MRRIALYTTPSDPRTAISRNAGCSRRSLGESRGLLSRASSLLSSPSEAPPYAQAAFSASANVPFQAAAAEHWQHNPVGATVRSTSCHRERLNIFRPQASRQRSRSVSVHGAWR